MIVRRLPRAWAFLALMAVLVAASPGPAWAQSDADRATARQLTAEAERKLTARDYEGAYNLLAKAYALVPSPMIKIGMGRAKVSMNQLIEAQQHFVDASKGTPKPNEPSSWAAARDTARQEAEAITPRLASFEFVIEGPPGPGALRVVIDGHDEVAKIALENSIPRAVNPGAHGVRAEADGFRPFETRASVAEGEKKKVSIRLEAAAPTPPPAPLTPLEGASADGPGAPLAGTPADAGAGRPRWNALTIGGVAAAGVFGTVGIVTGAMSWSSVSSIKGRCPNDNCPPAEGDKLDSAKTLGTVSTVAFVGALAGGAVALYGWLSANPGGKNDAKTQGKISLLVGPGSLGVGGRF